MIATHDIQKITFDEDFIYLQIDGKEIKDTNLTQVELGQPISINHLVTHVMSINDTFDLTTFKMTIKSSQYV